MNELDWKDAIEKILSEEKKQLHYTEIAELIAKRGYKISLGATPQNSVNSQLSTDIKKGNSIFEKVGKGVYILKKHLKEINENIEIDEAEANKTETQITKKIDIINDKIINAFGIYWNRTLVYWKPVYPDLFGIQQIGAKEVNFKDQKGIYLLHDSRETIYVGQE